MPFDRELQAALEASELASRALIDAYARFEVIPDAPATISTDADRRSQEIILGHLHRLFPSDSLCAEEHTATLALASHVGSRLWIVDPIDGTRGFARKLGEFSVMIAFVADGVIEVGVVQEPAKDRVTWASRGSGTWNAKQGSAPSRCQVSAIDNLAQATLTQSHSKDPAEPSEKVRKLQPGQVIETYSAGVKLALVARGEADLYLNTYDAVHDWDLCAGEILVTEAGGRVTKLDGEPLKYGIAGALQTGGVLASNGLLHVQAIQRMRA